MDALYKFPAFAGMPPRRVRHAEGSPQLADPAGVLCVQSSSSRGTPCHCVRGPVRQPLHLRRRPGELRGPHGAVLVRHGLAYDRVDELAGLERRP